MLAALALLQQLLLPLLLLLPRLAEQPVQLGLLELGVALAHLGKGGAGGGRW
jgi:hypothetical protein